MNKRIGKKDAILLGIVFLFLTFLFCLFTFVLPKKGNKVKIEVNKMVYGVYDLSVDQEIEIMDEDGKPINKLIIKDGVADMVEAECPDLLCVHQKSISKNKESIVCLPNRVVVTVLSEETDLDGVSN